MSHRHRLLVVAATVSIAAPLGAVPSPAQPPEAPPRPAAATAVAWQRIAVRTIYTEGLQAPPVGSLYLAFTSLAVHDAAQRAYGNVDRASAAVATAAHDVLAEYFPASIGALDADLTSTLAGIPDGQAETRGSTIGERAADRMIAKRVDDGRGDLSIVYDKDEKAGVWQPAPGGTMAAAWLGFVDPIVRIEKVRLNGPDRLRSDAYATDYDEVRDLGSLETPTAPSTRLTWRSTSPSTRSRCTARPCATC